MRHMYSLRKDAAPWPLTQVSFVKRQILSKGQSRHKKDRLYPSNWQKDEKVVHHQLYPFSFTKENILKENRQSAKGFELVAKVMKDKNETEKKRRKAKNGKKEKKEKIESN